MAIRVQCYAEVGISSPHNTAYLGSLFARTKEKAAFPQHEVSLGRSEQLAWRQAPEMESAYQHDAICAPDAHNGPAGCTAFSNLSKCIAGDDIANASVQLTRCCLWPSVHSQSGTLCHQEKMCLLTSHTAAESTAA